MGDTAPETVVSYAKIVDPAPIKEPTPPVDNHMKQSENDAREKHDSGRVSDDDDDDEGFQQVTNKKVEKLKEKEIQKLKEEKRRRKRDGGKRKFRKEREREKFKEKDGDKETDEKQESVEKEMSPGVKEDQKEFIPAPPPKTNPWKTSAANSENNNDNSETKQSVKTHDQPQQRKKRNSERDSREVQVKPRSKGNPWKKVEQVNSNNDGDSQVSIRKPEVELY